MLAVAVFSHAVLTPTKASSILVEIVYSPFLPVSPSSPFGFGSS